jgi:hypothetical protein
VHFSGNWYWYCSCWPVATHNVFSCSPGLEVCQEEEEEACKAVPETEEADVSVNLRRGLGLGSVSCLLAQTGKTMEWNA